MIIGIPKEIKNHEYRVGMTPIGIQELTSSGHKIYVQTQAGSNIGISDEDYQKSGAIIVPTAEDIFATSEMIIKVKEPQHQERLMLREDQILFTYLHLAPDPVQAQELIASNAVCIAYETVTDQAGR